MKEDWLKEQFIPLSLTTIILIFLILFLWLEIFFLNLFVTQKISLTPRIGDILVGLSIYLKTAIDFALFMGNLMKTNPGWKNRICIEAGTAMGNAIGTFSILALWTFFKEINWLLAIMVLIASLVLLRLAEESLASVAESENTIFPSVKAITKRLSVYLKK